MQRDHPNHTLHLLTPTTIRYLDQPAFMLISPTLLENTTLWKTNEDFKSDILISKHQSRLPTARHFFPLDSIPRQISGDANESTVSMLCLEKPNSNQPVFITRCPPWEGRLRTPTSFKSGHQNTRRNNQMLLERGIGQSLQHFRGCICHSASLP